MQQPHPIATNTEGASAYLGCTENRLAELCRRGIVKKLADGWYAYADLDQAIETIREERDSDPNVAYINPEEAAPKGNQFMKTPPHIVENAVRRASARQ